MLRYPLACAGVNAMEQGAIRSPILLYYFVSSSDIVPGKRMKMTADELGRRRVMVTSLRTFFLLAVASCFSASCFSAGSAFASDRLICCGAEEVFIIDLGQETNESPETVWSWKAEDSPEIPETGKRSFASTDECKPMGDFLLITSSSGGVALVRRSDKRCVFYTQAKNAHSACLLPHYRVAVASSFGGDELLVYELTKPDENPAKAIAKMPLRGAHGAIWDDERKRLWALGSDELLLVDVGDESSPPTLQVDQRIELPSPGGHDLSRSGESSTLFVTTNKHVYRFGCHDGRFLPAPALAEKPKVKSVSEHPQTGEIVYHQGTPENWWSDTIRFVGDRNDIQLEGRRLYKIRWDE